MKGKDLEDIRPASGGVKIKAKKKKQQRNEAQDFRRQKPEPARVERDVMPAPREELPPPTAAAAEVASKSKRAQEALIERMRGINRLMNSQVLAENRSLREQEEERSAVQALVQAAMNIERLSPGEGILGVATLAVRQGLSLRDAGNRLGYHIHQLEQRVKKLEKQLEKRDGEESSSGS